jgi:hypothetical protein
MNQEGSAFSKRGVVVTKIGPVAGLALLGIWLMRV